MEHLMMGAKRIKEKVIRVLDQELRIVETVVVEAERAEKKHFPPQHQEIKN